MSHEAGEYLREIVSYAAGKRKRGFIKPFDGFSEAAYREVSDLLGDRMRKYLGISDETQSLMPSVRALNKIRILESFYERRSKSRSKKSDHPDKTFLDDIAPAFEIPDITPDNAFPRFEIPDPIPPMKGMDPFPEMDDPFDDPFFD